MPIAAKSKRFGPFGIPQGFKDLIESVTDIGCRLYFDSNQTKTHASFTTLTWNQERYDYGGLHSVVSNTSRITIPESGVYCVWAQVCWAANTTGSRKAYLVLNGGSRYLAAYNLQTCTTASNPTQLAAACTEYFNAGDYIEVYVQHEAGADLAVLATSGNNVSEFGAHKVGGTTGPPGANGTGSIDIQKFTAAGANTWTKPANAKLVHVFIVGGAGAGATGRRGAAGTLRGGGGGGGGAGFSHVLMDPADLGATETATIGAFSVGGATPGDNSDGADGTDAGTTSFGSHLSVTGGGGGKKGTSTGGGAGGAGGQGQVNGTAGGAGGDSTNGGNGNAGVNASFTNRTQNTGGGGGGAVTAGNVEGNGGDGGDGEAGLGGKQGGSGATSHSIGASAGETSASQKMGCGSGGGMGASGTDMGGTTGVNGLAEHGGGAGGSGGTTNGGGASPGGHGATGVVWVVTYF